MNMEMTTKDPFSWDQDPVEKIILRSMNEGVITLECNGNIFTTNPAATRILGLGEADVKGKNFREILTKDIDNTSFTAFFEKVVNGGSHSLHEELTFQRSDGQKVDLSIAGSFLEFDQCQPGMQSVVVVFRDITAFKSLERAKMRAMNHLSHEIKTPLAIIQASVELLMRRDQFSESSLKSIERIRRNLTRLTDIQNIVEEILNPAPFNPQSFSLTTFVEQSLDKLGNLSLFRAVSLVSRIDEVNQDFMDPHILDLILCTLVKNSIENTPDQGEVIISISSIASGSLLQVQDYGVGIPLSDQEFIFEAFHNTQATDYYSSKEPFQFNAGGKGLELLRLKIQCETCFFEISFESRRCKYIPTSIDMCPGLISACPHIRELEDCRKSGGSTFTVLFFERQ